MNRRRGLAVVSLALVALSVIAAGGEGRATATTAQACPRMTQSVRQCVITPPGGYGTLNVAAAGASPGTPWIVADPGGAPMAWVNLYGLYSGGDGGKDPGGLVCVTWGVAASVACLTPRGTLILQPTGPAGPTGPPQVLTAADIALLHALRHAGLTMRDLPVLAAMAHAREAQ